MKGFLEFFKDLGFELSYMVAGFLGSLVMIMNKETRKRPFWEKAVVVISGILTANYITPLVIWVFDIPTRVQYGISFFIGLAGLRGSEEILDFVIDLSKTAKRKKK